MMGGKQPENGLSEPDYQAEKDLREIKMKIELHHIPEKAVTALMRAIREKSKHKEVMKAIKEKNGQLDDNTTNDLTSFLEEQYLRSEDDYRVYYLPLFNFGDPVWSPLRVEMFKRLRRASGINKTLSVVERVFTNDCNPEGNKEALQYLIHSLGKRGVLEEEDYGQLLKQPYSSLRIDWDGQCSLLEYAPDTIWKIIYKNKSFIAFATTNIDHVVRFILKIPDNILTRSNKLRCVERLLQLTVEMKSKQDSDKKAVASQILRQLLEDVAFEPRNEVHKHAAIELVQAYGVDPLDKPQGGDECTVTFAARRGPAFAELSIVLFEYGYQSSPVHMGPKRLEQLINEGIGDDALAAIIRSLTQKHPTVQLSRVMKKCARKGLVSSAEELYKFSPKPEDHPFILMVKESATRKPEEKYLRLLKEMNPDLYSPQSTIAGENTLHFAAFEGYTDLAKHVLIRGYTNLLWGENHRRMYPIQTALANQRFGTAEVLLRGTKDRGRLLKLFKRDCKEKPKISLCKLLKELVDLSEQQKMEEKKQVKESATRKPEEKYLRLLKEMNPDLYSPQSTIAGENTLHFAAFEGYTDLAKHVLIRGYTNLLWGENHRRMYPIQTALANQRFGTAEVLLRGTKDRGRLLKLFKRDCKEKPKISLCKLLKELVDLSEQQKMEEKKQLLDFILAVLDVTVSEDPHHELLEADENGYTPADCDVFRAPSCYDVIAEERLTEIQEHESFSTLVADKWKKYGAVIQSIPLILHLMFMALLTATLVLAAKSRDPSDYSQDTDWARLSLEVVIILWVILDLGFKLHGYCTYLNEHKRNCLTIGRALWFHITEWNNVLDILGIVFTLLIIPPRVVNNDWQWVFAALAYIFQGLRIFKHAVMIEPVGVYVAVLLLVMKRDLLRFLLLFSVLIISFGGGLFLALRGEIISNGSSNSSSNVSSNASDIDPVNYTSLGLYPYETSEIYYVWLTGFRILTEGSVIGYYGERGFSLLGIIIYWLLLFIVGILLLNILVVQFIHSYEEEAGRAQLNVVLTRTRLLHSMEKSYWAKRIIKLMKSKIKPLFWTRKTVECIASLFGSECKQKNVKERDKVHLQLQALEEIVHGIDITLRTQIQEKIDKQESRLELKHEVQKLTTDLKSELQHEVQKLTTDLKSELQHEVQKLTTDLKSELQHEVQKLTTDLKSELQHEVQKLTTDLKSELQHEVQKLTTDLKPLLSDLKVLLKARQPGTPV